MGTKYIHTVAEKTAIIEVNETENPVQMTLLNHHQYIQGKSAQYFCVRTILAHKLNIANNHLPNGYQFKILETYRSFDQQVHYWNQEIEKIKIKYPNFSIQQIEQKANEGIANPYGIGSGHQTGAAIDITLCHKGKELDMGTRYLDTSHPKTITDAIGLTHSQTANRKLLKTVLESVGLVNYPLEWWHYSYGEQEWAVITNHSKTLFAPISMHQIFKNIAQQKTRD